MSIIKIFVPILIIALLISSSLNFYQWNNNLALTMQNGREEMATLLIHAEAEINSKLRGLDSDLLDACEKLTVAGLTGTDADEILSDLYLKNADLVVNAATADASDILLAVQPSNYSGIIGEDIEVQEQNLYMHRTMRPALSNLIPLVEGFPGVVLVAPIFDENEELIGSLSLVIQPYQLIRPIAESIINSTGYSMWAMQTNGTLIFDPDPAQQGKNLFTDPIYADYPNVQAFAHQVADSESGYGTYSYYDKNLDSSTKTVVNKEAFWTTIGIYNTAWRLVIVHGANP